MSEKLRNSRGETLVEVLASVLICALSVMLLLGAVSASTSIGLQAQAADEDYYTALSKAERQSKVPGGSLETDIYNGLSGGTAITILSKDGSAVTIPAAAGESEHGLHFYGTPRLLSSALDPLPGLDSSGLAMTGGGG